MWQFCDVFYRELSKINKNFPTIENWTDWDVWKGYCSKSEFYGAVHAIHQRQDSDEFQPYPEAKEFLVTLKRHGFHITIASHRSSEHMKQTERWLKKHGLLYDDIHLSYDKTQLINSMTDAVVDDAPQVLEKAAEHGAVAAGLSFPWNREHANNGFMLFNNLKDILSHIVNGKEHSKQE